MAKKESRGSPAMKVIGVSLTVDDVAAIDKLAAAQAAGGGVPNRSRVISALIRANGRKLVTA